MRFTIIDAEQRSDVWRTARAGRLTGSRAGDMLATIKNGEAAARRDYKLQLVCERLTGAPQDDVFVNAAMQRGIDCEPQAFAAYEALTGEVVHRSGFLSHTDHMMGCSLDGHLDGFKGILECKCPKSATHLKYLRAGTVPPEHLPQILHNLYVTGADYCDFFSWDDRFPAPLQTFLVRVERAKVDLGAYEAAALKFLADVDAELMAVRTVADLPTVLKAAVA
jgi:predicted phage-related endonuclease